MKIHCNYSSRQAGQGLVVVIILLGLLGVGAWWLYSHKQAMDKEGRAFGREAVQELTVKYNADFLGSNLGPQGRLQYPPSEQKLIVTRFQEAGVPSQPIQIDENMSWTSQFFEPHGIFTAHLKYPARSGTLQLAISHPVSKWQVDDVTFVWDQPR